MANSDKNIVIASSTGSTSNPSITFSGANTSVAPQNMTVTAFPSNQGTLSFNGSNGQVFGVDNYANSAIVFSVNDMSGLPSIDVNNNGIIRLMPFPTDSSETILGGPATISAGTALNAPIKLDYKSLQTTPDAGSFEFNNGYLHFTNNSTGGRALIPSTNYFRLASNLTAIGSSISDFFGTNSALVLSAGATYEIEFSCLYTKTNAGTLTWSIVSNAAIGGLDAVMTTTPVAGFTGVPTGAAQAVSALINQTATTVAFSPTALITTGTTHLTTIKILLFAGSATNVRLRVTQSAGTITPLRGSTWKKVHVPSTNIGTYAT